MAGVIDVDDAFKAASALAFAALRTEFSVIALVDFTLVGAALENFPPHNQKNS